MLNGDIAEVRRMDSQGWTMPTGPRERTEEKEMSTGFLMIITKRTGGINRNSSLLKIGKGGNTVMKQSPHKSIYLQRGPHFPNPVPNLLVSKNLLGWGQVL